MKRAWWQRFLCLVLAGVMLFGMVPLRAFAHEPVTEETEPQTGEPEQTKPEEATSQATEPSEETIPAEIAQVEETLPPLEEQDPPAPLPSAWTRSVSTDGEFTYELLEDSTCKITGYNGTSMDVEIPETIDGYAVTMIGDHAFQYDEITSVVFHDTIIRIGGYAFYGCESLTELILPQSLTLLGYHSFGSCKSLETLEINGSSLVLDQRAFYGCNAVAEIRIGDGVVQIGEEEFYNFDALTTLDLGNGLTSIGGKAFYDCDALNILEVPEGVTTVGNSAFRSCDVLETVKLPDSVTLIDNYAFYYCAALKTLDLGSGLETIGQHAFEHCTSLTELVLPESLTTLGYWGFCDCKALRQAQINGNGLILDQRAFYGCAALAELTIGDGVVQIGEDEFYDFDTLTLLNLGSGLTDIGDKAFYDCDALTQLEIPASVTRIGNGAFRNMEALESLKFLDAPTAIGDYAFYYCRKLKNLDFGTRVVSIGRSGFAECVALTELTVPESVCALGNQAFNTCTGLTGLVLNGKLETMGENVFQYCSALKEVTIGDQAKVLGNYAFAYLDCLTSVTFGSGLTAIGNSAFYDCDALTTAVLPDSLTTLGSNAFYSCNALSDVSLGGGLTVIGDDAFYNCREMTALTLPDSLSSIGKNAFYSCTGLTNLTVGNGLTDIGNSAFHNCTGLKTLNLPDTLTNVGNGAFYGCTGLTEVDLGSGLTCIGSSAFYGCDALTGVELPEGLVTLGDSAFYSCDKLAAVAIPASVTNVGSSVFAFCSSLAQVELAQGLTVIGDRMFRSTAVAELSVPDSVTALGDYAFANCGKLTSVQLPQGLTAIGEYAFDGCVLLASIEIPETVTSIGSHAFSSCRKLEQITVPGAVTELGNMAFAYCDVLTQAELNEGLNTIGDAAFHSCVKLNSVSLPDTLTSIGNEAFAHCKALADITLPEGLETIGYQAFYACTSLTEITVPSKITALERGTFASCEGLAQVELPEGLTVIGNFAFQDCKALSQITLPEELETLGYQAFYDCDALTQITIPGKITAIGRQTFYDCNNLSRVDLSEGLKTIGSNVFQNCDAIVGIALPDSLEILGYGAFLNCDGLAEITVPAGVTTIEGNAFSNCNHLARVNLSEGLKSIGSYAFERCNALTHITLPESLETLSSYAFYENDALREIALPAGITTLENSVFYGCGALEKVDLPEGLTAIGNGAFYNCDALTQIILPESLNTMGPQVFYDCDSLTGIAVPAGVSAIGGYTFQNCGKLEWVELPENLTSIGPSAFQNCDALTGIVLPESLISLGNQAFHDCDALVKITVPSGITTIESSTFSGCAALEQVELPAGLTTIKSHAFLQCPALADIELPEGLLSVENQVFYDCDSLTRIRVPSTVTVLSGNVFAECGSLTQVELPEGLKRIDGSAFYNCARLSQITLPESLEILGGSAFQNCVSLTEIRIPTRITNIPNSAFFGCSALEQVELHEGVTVIGHNAFRNCSALARITLPDSLETLESYAFYNCDTLTEISIPEQIILIRYSTFGDCDRLERVDLPEGLTGIEYSAFAYCGALNWINLPENLTSIGNGAFQSCQSLTDIQLPTSLTRLENSVFAGCTGLISATVHDAVEYIGTNAFYNCPNLSIVTIPGCYAWTYAEANGIPTVNIDDGLSVLHLSVKTELGAFLQEGYTVNWYKAGEDLPIATGTMLRGMEEGSYEYELILDETLHFTYIQPRRTAVEYSGGTLRVDLTLESVGQVRLSGIITAPDGTPIKGAKLAFTQTYGTAEKKYTVFTDAGGGYSLTMAAVPAVGTLSAEGYYGRALNLNLLKGKTEQEFSTTLAPLPSNKIALKILLKQAGGEEYSPVSYEDVDLDFRVENLTRQTRITDYVFQSGNLVISAECAGAQDLLRIQALDADGKMQAQPVEVTLDAQKNGSAEIRFLENGRFILRELTGCEEKLLMLFDGAGEFLSAADAASGYTGEALEAGSYTLVLIQKTTLLRSVANLAALEKYGLEAGTDYTLQSIVIEDGELTQIDSIFVPALDLSKLSYTVAENTAFTVNKPLAFAGEYIVLRVAYEIDEKYSASGQQIRIRLSDELSIAGGSLTLDGKKHVYSLEDNVLTVNTNRSKGVIRFYISPGSVGDYQIQAELSFASGADTLIQPLGGVDVKVVAAKMNLPKKTSGGFVTVTGKAVPDSTITFYDFGVEIGSTRSNAAGSFKARLELELAGNYTYHQISAQVSNDRFEQPLAVEGQTLINDEAHIQLSKITMINIAHDSSSLEQVEYVSEFDFINPGPAPNYWFWPGCYPEFTFIVEFVGNGAGRVENVNVVTVSNTGGETVVECFYDEANDRWLGTHEYKSANDAPMGVSATYDVLYQETEGSVPKLDTDLIDRQMEQIESIIGPDEDILEDWDSAMDDVEVDTDTPFTPEEAEELESLAQKLDEMTEQMNTLRDELLYEERSAWADQGVTFTQNGDTQIYEGNGQKIEITTQVIPDATRDALIEEGYALRADSEKMSIYERRQEDGTVDQVVLDHPSGEATKVSTKATDQSSGSIVGETTEKILKNIATNKGIWASCTEEFLDKVAVPAMENKVSVLQKNADEFLDTARAYHKVYKRLEAQGGELAESLGDYYNGKYLKYADDYLDTARAVNRMDAVTDLAKLGKTGAKFAGDVLNVVGTVTVVSEFVGYHRRLNKLSDFMPENCAPDQKKWEDIQKRIRNTNIGLVASDVLVAGGEITTYAFAASGVGFLPSLALSVGNTIVQGACGAGVDHSLTKIKNDVLTLDCNGDGIPDGDPLGLLGDGENSFMPATTVIDPSGYVYEAVPSNRVQGVRAEAYYLGYALDEWGVPKEEAEDILWDAENYDQVNPVYTDALGMFHWDVPMGRWLVKFSKEGYYDTDSRSDPAADEDGYLPVPPPQVEVNTAIVSKAAPKVESINLYDDRIQIIFSQYMQPDSVSEAAVTVTSGGEKVDGTLTPANAEYNFEQTEQYASVFTFVPERKLDETADVRIEGCVNYAGKAMEEPYTASGTVKYRPESIYAGENNQVTWNETGKLEIQILPARAGANQTVSLRVLSSSILAASEEILTTDDQGKATVDLAGLLPGSADVLLTLEGTDITSIVSVAVVQKAPQIQTCEKVTANLPTGSVVEPGTELILTTATDGAEIYYTLDGTCPCVVDSPSRILYTGPIVLQEDTFLIAYAVKAGWQDSATAGFIYSVKKPGCSHAETKLVNEKAPTCTESGYTGDRICLECEVTLESGTRIPAKGHTESVIPGKAATCTEPGLKEGKRCAVCDTVLEEQAVVPAKGHDQAADPGVAPTCTDPGLTEGKHCPVCGEILIAQETVPPAGHSFGDWIETVPATSLSGGEEKRTCESCGIEEKRGTEKLVNPFEDVEAGAYYEAPVLWAVKQGITNGMSPTTFAPDSRCIRAQVVTFLWRAAGEPEPTSRHNPFVDVLESDYFYKAVLWAVEKGITNGMDPDHFGSQIECTRAQVATFLWRAQGQPRPASNSHPFTDINPTDYYYNAVLWAVEAGVTNGMTPTTFAPNAGCTRGQIVTFLYRALK